MTDIVRAIRHGLSNLTRFSGREPPLRFWPYVLSGIALAIAAMAVAFAATMAPVFARMQRFAAEHPEQATVTTGPGHYSVQIEGPVPPDLFPDFTPLVFGMAVAIAIAVVLLAATVARRLHDRGLSGAWGLAPLPFLAVGLALLPKVFTAQDPSPGLLLGLFFNNVLYMALLALLAVLLFKGSDPGPNRYGPPNVA